MPRAPDIAYENLSTEQRKVHDTIVAGPRGRIEGPLKVWLASPDLAERAQELGVFCRYQTSLPPRLSELAILIVGAFWRAGYEWHAHAPLARKAGLDPGAIEAIRTGKTPQLVRADEAALYDFARELLEHHRVKETTYARALTELGIQQLVELVGILGYYGLISMTINAFDVALPSGAPEPFTQGE
jgi:4-carboxymuconolactone decarboxylase